MLLSMHKKIPYDYVSQFQDCSLQVLPAGNRKTGLIEKKSAGMIKEWKAYSFELDYMRGIFKCKKSGVRSLLQLHRQYHIMPLKIYI